MNHLNKNEYTYSIQNQSQVDGKNYTIFLNIHTKSLVNTDLGEYTKNQGIRNKTKDMTFQRITEPNNPCNFGKKQQQKVVKKMKKFFNCFTSKSHYQTSEKIRVTYHTQNGIMVEHVESDGSCNVIFDNLNLCGGGRKRMPVKNEKRKGSKGQNKMKIERKN